MRRSSPPTCSRDGEHYQDTAADLRKNAGRDCPPQRIGIFLDLENHYGRQTALGIQHYFRSRTTWSLRLAYAHEAGNLKNAGCTAWISMADARSCDQLTGSGLPVIGMFGGDPKWPFPRIDIDQRSVGSRAGAFLAGLPLRSFACAYVPGQAWSARRLDGFRASLAAAGHGSAVLELPLDEDCIAKLAAAPRPLGIFAVNDLFARQMLASCQRAGLGVPGDAVLVGCDDDELQCHLCTPALSSVVIPWREVGMTAARCLERVIHGQAVSQRTLIAAQGVVERQSTSLSGVVDPRVQAALLFIRERALTGIGPAAVARHVGVALRTLESAFRLCSSDTVAGLISQHRLEAAAHLLRETSLPVSEVASRCGFASAAYFSSAFRERFHRTPRSLRQ